MLPALWGRELDLDLKNYSTSKPRETDPRQAAWESIQEDFSEEATFDAEDGIFNINFLSSCCMPGSEDAMVPTQKSPGPKILLLGLARMLE